MSFSTFISNIIPSRDVLLRSSETSPESTACPSRIMVTDPHSSDTSLRIWVLMRSEQSLFFRPLRISLTSTIPLGSRPDVGSSRIMISGLGRSACASTSLCFIPLENPSTFVYLQSQSFISSRTSRERMDISSLSRPYMRPT